MVCVIIEVAIFISLTHNSPTSSLSPCHCVHKHRTDLLVIIAAVSSTFIIALSTEK